ncbi:MAG: hypothetical protein QOG54_660 [Actinomycetota bacterium]|nr:hypothetical protein [Actinomycetota bacterium]
MSPRASLPGADELFRKTGPDRAVAQARPEPVERQDNKSTKLQVATSSSPPVQTASQGLGKSPKHGEKITFYCTAEDLMDLERARLKLRSEHGLAADRGKIVRAALAYVLEDFDARADDSILLRRLND